MNRMTTSRIRPLVLSAICAAGLAACTIDPDDDGLGAAVAPEALFDGWYHLKSVSASPQIVAHADHAGCSELQREDPKSGDPTQQWAIVPAGAGFAYMCSRKTGTCASYKGFAGLLTLRAADASDDQMISIGRDGDGYGFKFKSDGEVMHQSRDLTSCSARGAIKHRDVSRSDRKRQRFALARVAAFHVPPLRPSEAEPGNIPLPPEPQGSTQRDAPPSETKPVLIGEMRLPYIAVADPLYPTPEQQVRNNALHYKLVREQNWRLQKFQEYGPGEQTFEWCRWRGLSRTRNNEFESTTGIKIMADYNVSFAKKKVLNLKGEFEERIRVKQSSAASEMTEEKETNTYKVTARRSFSVAQWQLQDVYRLYRYDGAGNEQLVQSWSTIDDRYNPRTTFPRNVSAGATVRAADSARGAGGC
jgi:hypothetical protein